VRRGFGDVHEEGGKGAVNLLERRGKRLPAARQAASLKAEKERAPGEKRMPTGEGNLLTVKKELLEDAGRLVGQKGQTKKERRGSPEEAVSFPENLREKIEEGEGS